MWCRFKDRRACMRTHWWRHGFGHSLDVVATTAVQPTPVQQVRGIRTPRTKTAQYTCMSNLTHLSFWLCIREAFVSNNLDLGLSSFHFYDIYMDCLTCPHAVLYFIRDSDNWVEVPACSQYHVVRSFCENCNWAKSFYTTRCFHPFSYNICTYCFISHNNSALCE